MEFTLEELKNYLRVDFDEDDNDIMQLPKIASAYIYSITGKNFKENPLARHYCKLVMFDLYSSHSQFTDSESRLSPFIKNLLYTLIYEKEY